MPGDRACRLLAIRSVVVETGIVKMNTQPALKCPLTTICTKLTAGSFPVHKYYPVYTLLAQRGLLCTIVVRLCTHSDNPRVTVSSIVAMHTCAYPHSGVSYVQCYTSVFDYDYRCDVETSCTHKGLPSLS